MTTMQRVAWAPLALVGLVGMPVLAGPGLVKLDLAPIDAEVPHALSDGLGRELEAELRSSFALVPREKIDGVRAGTEEEPDVTAAVAAIAEARQAILAFNNAAAGKKLAQAKALLDPVRLRLRDYRPLTNLLLYSAVVAMNNGDKKATQAAFAELARLRPDYRIDAAEFPPNVLQAFDKVRYADQRLPRGRLVVTSTPPGAKVFVDEVESGVTPVTVPASPGPHIVRWSASGFLSLAEQVDVESYAKLEKDAKLSPNPGMQALKKLEAEVVQGGTPDAVLGLGTPIAAALGADAVVAGVVGVSVDGFLVSMAYLPKSGAPQVMAIDLDQDGARRKQVVQQLAAALISASTSTAKPAAGTKVIIRSLGSSAPSRAVDFERYALGVAPGGAAAVLKARAAKLAAIDLANRSRLVQQQPTRWWLWVGAGVVAAAAGGTAYYVTRPSPGVAFSLERQP